VSQLENENASLLEQVDSLKAERQIHVSRIDQEQSKVKIQDATKSQLSREISALRAEVEQAEAKNLLLSSKVSATEALASQIPALQAQLKEASSCVSEQALQLDELAGLQTELKQKDKLVKELAELERKLVESRREATSLQEQLKASQTLGGELEKQTQHLRAELAQKRLAEVASQKNPDSPTVPKAEKFRLSLQTDLDVALEEKTSLRKELQDCQQQLSEVEAQLLEAASQKDSFETEVAALQRDNKSAKESAKIAEAERKEENEKHRQLAQTASEFQRKAEISEAEVKGLRSQLSDSADRISLLSQQQDETRKVRKQLAEEAARLAAAQHTIEFLQERLTELESKVLNQPQLLLELSASTEQVERHKAKLLEQAEKWTAETLALREALEGTTLAEQGAVREREVLKAELASSKARLLDQTQLLEQVTQLKRELDKRKKEARQTVILQEIALIKDQVQRDNQTRPDVFQELASLKEALSNKEAQDQAYRVLLEDVARLRRELEAEKAKSGDKIGLEVEVQDLRTQLEGKERALAKVESSCTKLREEHAELEEEISLQEQECTRLDSEVIAVRKEMAVLSSQSGRRETSYAAQARLANEQIEKLQAELDRFQEESFSWSLQKSTQESEIGVLRTKLEQSESSRREQEEKGVCFFFSLTDCFISFIILLLNNYYYG